MSHITKIEHIHYDKPIAVYDVKDVQPSHNFAVQTGDLISFVHNCGML